MHIQYLQEPTSSYVEASVETVRMIHKYENAGDILVFQADRQSVELITSVINSGQDKSLYAIPLFSGLSMTEQLKAIERPPRGHRKVVVATSIAEASVTIDGIVYVVDPGMRPVTDQQALLWLKFSIPRLGLRVSSQAPRPRPLRFNVQAERVFLSISYRNLPKGRTRPGKAFRLYTEETFDSLRDNSVPAIKRSNLAAAVLQIKALGVENVLRFDFLSPPPSAIMTHALELLYSLKAVDEYARLTRPLGMSIAEAPIDPMISTMVQSALPRLNNYQLLASLELGCAEEALTIAAMLTVSSVFYSPRHKKKAEIELERAYFAVEEGM